MRYGEGEARGGGGNERRRNRDGDDGTPLSVVGGAFQRKNVLWRGEYRDSCGGDGRGEDRIVTAVGQSMTTKEEGGAESKGGGSPADASSTGSSVAVVCSVAVC